MKPFFPLPGLVLVLTLTGSTTAAAAGAPVGTDSPFATGRFTWRASGPLLGPAAGGADPQVSVKDPSFVYHEGRWHLFATRRFKSGKVDLEYCNFRDWSEAAQAPRCGLDLHDRYHAAPQVFFFTPHQRWYLVYQLADPQRTPAFGPYFSTTTRLADPRSWTRPAPLITNAPAEPRWLDFWVICDAARAHLFYASLDGRMWRCATRKTDFPAGWSAPELALQADIFEAAHTYRLRGADRYLTLIEARGDGRRYYKAYLADRLEGPWRGLADSLQRPFAGLANVRQAQPWTANFSHGELVRAGVDEHLEVDPAHLRFVFQGASDAEYRGNPYGQIPWRLGMLAPEPPEAR